ncbi:kinase-like domain-containing protein [Halenospora varia]|nr:kinase-like domain-containing protein [Halenospora varia]
MVVELVLAVIGTVDTCINLARSQLNLLQKLEGKLLQATSLIKTFSAGQSNPGHKGLELSRKFKYSMFKDRLDELIVDLEAWQNRFDPTWYLILLISGSVVDSALVESERVTFGGLTPTANPLQNIIALRRTIKQENKVENLEAGVKLLLAENVEPLSGTISQVKVDVESLARKLKQIDPDTFGLLRCYGILKRRDKNEHLVAIEMVYQTPKDCEHPTSLRQLLLQQKPVSVSAIVRLAKQLIRSVSYIHACDFVHKNIRPENIVVFPEITSPLGSSFLLGFNLFRSSNFQTNLVGDPAWHRNLYRHPQRQGTFVQDRYVMQHDIYSLGVCLLEIGLWRSFLWYPNDSGNTTPVPGFALGLNLSDDQFQTVQSTTSLRIKDHLADLARRELPSKLGDMYTDIVLACLECLDPENQAFGTEQELADGDGILVGVRFVEKVLTRVNQISI